MIVRPMLLRTAAVLVLAAAGIAVVAAAPRAAEAVGAPAASIAVPAVTAAVAQRREMVDSLLVSGNLIARQEALVNAEVDGLKVIELLADEGDRVQAGQVLARLNKETLDTLLAQNDAAIARADAAVAQAEWAIPQAEAAFTEARAALNRTMTLKESGNTTQELIDQRTAAARTTEARLSAARSGLQVAKAEKASAEAQRAELKLRLARTEIRSPVSGVVSRRNVRLGAIAAVAATEPMFRIIANGEVEFEAEVLETQVARLRTGAPVTVTPAGGQPVEGRIRLLPAEIDPMTRLGKVRVSLPQSDALRVGSFARAAIVVERREGIAVPTPAVLFGAAGERVQVVRDGRIAERKVKAGITAGGYTEILDGLAAGEQVIAKAGAFLRDGDAVRVADQTGAK
ncbi:efflux RND transporter periplasmic adaptor subunit [Alsobacter sp. R-9]